MLKKLFFSLTAVVALSLVVMAQDKSVTLTGHIVDKACSAREAKKDAPGAAHTKGCSLMENCAKSGFGVFADGKYTECSTRRATRWPKPRSKRAARTKAPNSKSLARWLTAR